MEYWSSSLENLGGLDMPIFNNVKQKLSNNFNSLSNKIVLRKNNLDNCTLQRNSSFELLRIISIVAIVLLHMIHQSGGRDIDFSTPKVVNYFFSTGGRMFVNCFVMIGAYFLVDKSFSFKRIIKLWFETFIICILFTSITYFAYGDVTIKDFVKCFVPVLSSKYWFISVYIALLLITPILNLIVNKFEKNKYLITLIMGFILIVFIKSFLPINLFYYNDLIWFSYLYILIGFIKHYDIPFFNGKRKNLIVFIFCYLMMFAITVCSDIYVNYGSKYVDLIEKIKLYYSNHYETIFCFFGSLDIFNFFREFNFTSKFINYIASITFYVYLIHQTPIFYNHLWIDILNLNLFINKNYFIFICFGSVLMIFIVSAFIKIVIDFIIKFIMQFFLLKKI